MHSNAPSGLDEPGHHNHRPSAIARVYSSKNEFDNDRPRSSVQAGDLQSGMPRRPSILASGWHQRGKIDDHQRCSCAGVPLYPNIVDLTSRLSRAKDNSDQDRLTSRRIPSLVLDSWAMNWQVQPSSNASVVPDGGIKFIDVSGEVVRIDGSFLRYSRGLVNYFRKRRTGARRCPTGLM